MISESFQTGELSSDLDCQKEKLKQKDSCDSSNKAESSGVLSPIAMRYWNYCTGRGGEDQTPSSQSRGRAQWRVSSIHSESAIPSPDTRPAQR